jgi:uncharacterized protein (DUF58 family)
VNWRIRSFMIPRTFKQAINQFINRRGREDLPVRFHWRRIYVLPSKPGLFFAVIWFLMMMAGLNFNNNMSLMLVFLLFGLAQVLLHKTFFNLRNLTISNVHADPVFLGNTAKLTVQLNADDEKWQILGHAGMDDQAVNILEGSTVIRLNTPTRQRGLQAVPRLKFFTRFPVGLFTVWVYCTPRARFLVYPKPESPCPPFPSHGGLDGEQTTVFKGDELSGIRDYRQGDPIRDIAWKKSAQTDQTWVKEFHQVQGKHLVFDYQQMQQGSTEFKLSRLTAWILAAEDNQAHYQLLLPGYDSGLTHGEAHKHQCLKALAEYRSGGVA